MIPSAPTDQAGHSTTRKKEKNEADKTNSKGKDVTFAVQRSEISGGERKGPSFMVSDQRNLKGHHDNGNFSDKCSLEKN